MRDSLGVSTRSLFPKNGGGNCCRGPTVGRKRKTHETASDAVAAATWSVTQNKDAGWALSHSFSYVDKSGDREVMRVLRFESKAHDEKTFIPIHSVEGGWQVGSPPGHLPLYKPPRIPADELTLVVEGEKAADAASGIGLCATTSPHGAGAAARADWTPFNGRSRVIILPDNNAAGIRYARDVERLLRELDEPPDVQIVVLPDLPDGGDIADFVDDRRRRGQSDDEIRAEVEELVASSNATIEPSLASPEGPHGCDEPDAASRAAERAIKRGLLSYGCAEAYRRALTNMQRSVGPWSATKAASALAGIPDVEEDVVVCLVGGEEEAVRAAFRNGGSDSSLVVPTSIVGAGVLYESERGPIPLTWEVTNRRSADTGTLRAPGFADRLSIDNASRRRSSIKKLAAKLQLSTTEASLDALERALAELIEIDADARIDYAEGDNSESSDADVIVELVKELGVELFHTPGLDPDCFATVPIGDHREVWHLDSRGFKRWVAHAFHTTRARVPSETAMVAARNVLAGQALFEGPEHEVFVRRAFVDGRLFIDLADGKGTAIEIDEAGWRAVDPVGRGARFLRKSGTLPLPMPVQGGSVDELRTVVNVVDDDDWALVKGFLFSCLHPTGPYLGLAPNGEHGCGKSWFTKTIRRTIDPSDRDVRRPVTNEPDLAIAASSSLIVAVDNLSRLSDTLSDAYCSLTTGASLTKRRLYTDFDEASAYFKRPVMLNGISNVATRADLADRVLPVQLERIRKKNKRGEGALEKAFLEMHPRVLGALCTAASVALRRRDEVTVEDPERMVDVLVWVTAAEKELGIDAGGFQRAYAAKVTGAAREALEASPVAVEILELMEAHLGADWCGTCKELDSELASRRGEGTKPPTGWPKTPQGLSHALRRAAPLLRREGIEVVEPGQKDRPRKYVLQTIRDGAPSDKPDHEDRLGISPADVSWSDPDVWPGAQTSAESGPDDPVGGHPDVSDVCDVSGGPLGTSVAEWVTSSARDPLSELSAADQHHGLGDELRVREAGPTTGEGAASASGAPTPRASLEGRPENVGNVGNVGTGPHDPAKADSGQTFGDLQTSETSTENDGERTASSGLDASVVPGSDPDEEEREWTA